LDSKVRSKIYNILLGLEKLCLYEITCYWWTWIYWK